MKIIILRGKVRETFIETRDDRTRACRCVHENLSPLKNKGDSIVWTKSGEKQTVTDTATIVDRNGRKTTNSAVILMGGSKMQKVKKIKKTDATVSEEVLKNNPAKVVKEPVAVKVAKGITKTAKLAKTLRELPKSGKTIEQIIEACGMNEFDVRNRIGFMIEYGTHEKKGDKVLLLS